MRRTRVALIVNALWLVAFAAAGGALYAFGLSWLSVGLALVAGATALSFGTLIAQNLEHDVQLKLAQLGKAVGVANGRDLRDGMSIEAIVANLAGRLERASQFKTALAGLAEPVAMVSAEGEIIGASWGLSTIEPRAIEGASVDVLFGQGYFDEGGGVAEESLVRIGGVRYAAHRRAAGAGRFVVELKPAGAFIADDDLDAFASALAGGQTSFRFDEKALMASPALRVLGDGIETLDLGVQALNRLAAGERLTHAMRNANAGIAPQVRDLSDLIAALTEERDEHAEARDGLERKCSAVLAAIDKYRISITAMAELAESSRSGLNTAGESIGRGRDKAKAARQINREARDVLGNASLAADRADRAAGGVESASAEIDKMVAAIEDVSFRTNLLALNAAVEAARAGEKGAGFAVVADEVRMLAQLTQKTSRDIRGLVGISRSQSSVGAQEASGLKNLLGDLTRHLENLSNETDMIAGALDEGSGAISRLDTQVTSLGDQASRALTLPARRQDKAGTGG
ncbi:MAG: methyl-accepting chemotaxis protein [Devosia sp.]